MEREQLGDQRNDEESNLNSGDGTSQMAQPWLFMMMMKIIDVGIFLLYFINLLVPEFYI
jgi:hypothetical protein